MQARIKVVAMPARMPPTRATKITSGWMPGWTAMGATERIVAGEAEAGTV
jgi:hypothetical protein